ncbi:MAG: sugar dehydrogenase [Planctomycetes bacterium]|nr:sugar dehydrogenase [Planctomycetota bacterium]
MLSSQRLLCSLFNVLSWLVFTSFAVAQNFFPATIPTSPLAISIEEFATIPDSSTNSPARVSVLTRDPSGRLFANDQRGPLYTINATGSTVTEYLDLRDFSALAINSGGEPGFQSFVFHPDFATPGADGFGRFYTIHSSNNTSATPDFDPGGGTSFHTLLLEWRTDDPAANTFTPANASQPFREVLRLKQPFGNHNAGLIAFNTTVGPADTDYGNLYVAVGDGGSGGDPQENGQDPSNPYGALLRIDPLGTNGINGQYGIVAENALAADGMSSTLGEIYAYGLRNPQRFGWDATTGNMYIADIGQNAVEEIDLGVNGADYGWDNREGSFSFENPSSVGFTDPVAEYDHVNLVSNLPAGVTGGRAITVGEVARGTGFPGFDGQLLLGDFPTGLIFMLDVDSDPLDGGQDGLTELQPLDSSGEPVRLLELINDARAARGLGSTSRADLRFGINTPGEVYITNKRDGIIRRLVFDASPGDFNGDGEVDADDLVIWNAQFGLSVGATVEEGDADGDFDVDGADFLRWQQQFTGSVEAASFPPANVPEPSTCGLIILGLLTISYSAPYRRK